MEKSEMVQALISSYAGGKKSEFARMLGIAPNTLANWIAGGTFDSERIFARCKNINPAWLLSGEGEIRLPATEDASAGFGAAEGQAHKPSVKENILQYLQQKGISVYRCYNDSGITRGVLHQLDNSISEENLVRFIEFAPDVNITWLLTGKGDMLSMSADGQAGTAMLLPMRWSSVPGPAEAVWCTGRSV